MLFAEDNEVAERLEASILHKTIHDGHGRTEGALNKSHEERVMAGVLGNLIGNKQTEEATGIKASEVATLKRGVIGRSTGTNESLKQDIEERMIGIKDKVLDKLIGSIEALHPEELNNPVSAAKVASSLAGVVEKLSDKGQQQGNHIQIVVFKPELESLDAYETVELPTLVRSNK